jgi:hypothetical protein
MENKVEEVEGGKRSLCLTNIKLNIYKDIYAVYIE